MLKSIYKAFTFLTCADCQHTQLSDSFRSQDLYDRNYFLHGPYGCDYGNYRQQIDSAIHEQIRSIMSYLPTTGRWLDIGCAYGYAFDESDLQLEKFGLDVSSYAIKRARELFPDAKFKAGDVQNLGDLWPRMSFSLITLFDIFEHINDPAAALQQIKKALSPDGLIYICTYIFPGFSTDSIEKRPRDVCPPYHLQYYTEKSIAHLMQRNQLKIVSFQSNGNFGSSCQILLRPS